jgi:hypothetical protein
VARRIADRLKKLDALLTGEQTIWARLRENREGTKPVASINVLDR